MGTRRDFLKKSAMLTTAALVAPTVLSSCGKKQKEIGLQIYTVRDQLNEDLEGTLKRLAEIGYNSVEAAGFGNGRFYGKDPKEFTKMLNDMGMKFLSSHTVFEPDVADDVCAAHAEAGCKYIVYPYLPGQFRENLDGYKNTADKLNTLGQIAQKHGLQFAYHNHNFEFEPMEGQVPMDVLLSKTDPQLVKSELDLYWITKGGHTPVEYFNKFPGRFELWHVKDMDNSPEQFFAAVGTGTIDFKPIFAAREKAGMKHFFVEEDRCKGDIWEDLNTSFTYLNNASFV